MVGLEHWKVIQMDNKFAGLMDTGSSSCSQDPAIEAV
jgi:hypothetical protein